MAAIRSVLNGGLSQRISVLAGQVKGDVFKKECAVLSEMTELLKKAIEEVQKPNNLSFVDFHARRLVEIGGFIAISYLLILDSERCTCEKNCFEQSARRFVRYAQAQIMERALLVNDIDVETYQKDYASTANSALVE